MSAEAQKKDLTIVHFVIILAFMFLFRFQHQNQLHSMAWLFWEFLLVWYGDGRFVECYGPAYWEWLHWPAQIMEIFQQ